MLIFKLSIYRNRQANNEKTLRNKSLKLKGKKLKSKNYQNTLSPPKKKKKTNKNVHRKEFLIT